MTRNNPRPSPNPFLPFRPRLFGMHPFTLTFEGEMEHDYRDYFLNLNLPYIRIAVIIGTMVWVLFGVGDLLYLSQQWSQLWILRFGIGLPAFLLLALIAFHQRMRNWVQPSVTLAVLLASMLIIAGANLVQRPTLTSHIGGQILLIFAAYTFLRLRFTYALIAGIGVAVLYTAEAALTSAMPAVTVFYANLYFLSANLFGGFAGYAMEYYNRRDFLHDLDAERERELEIETANLRTAKRLASSVTRELSGSLKTLYGTYESRVKPNLGKFESADRDEMLRIPATLERMSELLRRLLRLTDINEEEGSGDILRLAIDPLEEPASVDGDHDRAERTDE